MAVRLDELCQYLDGYLRHDEIADYGGAMNGLQVEGPEVVTRVAAAVDACQTTIEQAADAGAELILVHHGLFWGAPFPLTGARFRRISTLIEKGIAVYSSHLPLDVHPEVGNNPLLVRELGIEVTGEFAEYKGVPVALSGTWEGTRDDLVRDVARIVGAEPRLLPFGPERIERVGVLTGAGGSVVAEAAAAGVDTFVTGEGSHPCFFDAEENGLNLILAGHYATETIGVRALAAHLATKYDLEMAFLSHPTGL